MLKLLLLCVLIFFVIEGKTQNTTRDTVVTTKLIAATEKDTTTPKAIPQVDIIDILYWIVGKNPSKRHDTSHVVPGKLYFSGALNPSYSLQTGLAAEFTGNFAFYLGDKSNTNISSILADFAYTQYNQLLLPAASSIWTKNNEYNFVGDTRFLKYPQDTYGIGSQTKMTDAYTVNYDYVKFYEYVLRKIKGDLYAGIGVNYDNHFNIQEEDVPEGKVTDFDKWGFSKSSISSGLALNVQYNTVKNMIDPEGGAIYANLIVRQNFTWMGSNAPWTGVVIDFRKYFAVGHKSNVFAIWTYDWLTTGHTPYLDLPSNGWDTYSNTGRGYIQSRYRGPDMLDLEAEFRYGIMRNGLIGGVVFANVESFSDLNRQFNGALPGVGAGLRFQFNKFSRTNIAVDYAFGVDGSKGIFINLGEVF